MDATYTPREWAVADLLAAVQRLPPRKLREFSERFAALQAPGRVPEPDGATLVRATRMRLPADESRRLRQLSRQSEEGHLSAEDAPEYQALAERAEELDVLRVQALAELVRRWKQPVGVVKARVGWETGSDAA